MKDQDLVEAMENETKFCIGKLGSGNFRHLINKRISRNSKKYIRGSKLSEMSLEWYSQW